MTPVVQVVEDAVDLFPLTIILSSQGRRITPDRQHGSGVSPRLMEFLNGSSHDLQLTKPIIKGCALASLFHAPTPTLTCLR